MAQHLHHAHLFASDLDKTLAFYRDLLGGEVVLDTELAGARNVFLRLGSGRLHFYDQAPRDQLRGPIHHLGIQTDDLEALLEKLRASGFVPREQARDFGLWKYTMVAAPDGILLELFEVRREAMPDALKAYFE